jgi:predicted transcriptional regulator
MDAKLHATAQIVGALSRRNGVAARELAGLIASVHAALTGEPLAPHKPTAAQIRKSVTADYIVSFEDGRQYRAIRKHLTSRGLTPEEYRTKWGLPGNYPMVAPGYRDERVEIAKRAGLGTHIRKSGRKQSPQGR